jgi:pyruvate formate lyase activating enzyme
VRFVCFRYFIKSNEDVKKDAYLCAQKSMTKGIVFSIEEFALNDGPGIRTTVFLKGCPLRCAWCHNPEGFSFAPEVLKTSEGERLCGEIYTPRQLADKLLRYSDFFAATVGGVTFTGGEPLAQPDFLAETLGMLTGMIHTAIETSGYASPTVFRQILTLTDLTLFDIKSMDPVIHEQYTGVSNAMILKNLAYLCDSGKAFVIRLPLIPGVNDTLEQITAVLDAVKGAQALQRVEMLPYHKTAGAKYALTGRVYSPPFDTQAEVQIHDVFSACGIKVIRL